MKLSTKQCCCYVLLTTLAFAPELFGKTSEGEETTLLASLKGESTENQFFLGMYTFHFTPSSLKTRNWQQNLIGFQYNDFFFGTFENSFYTRSWTAGWARNLKKAQLINKWDLAIGYRVGVATGYEEGQAPLSSVSPVIPIVELYSQFIFKEHYGVELMLTTSLSVGFFYQF